MSKSRALFVKSIFVSMLAGSLCLTSGCTKVGPEYVVPIAQDELEIEVQTGDYLGVLPERADITNW